MIINDSNMLKIIRANFVSSVISENFENYIDILKSITDKNARVWCCFPDNTTIVTLYARLKQSNISVDYVKTDKSYTDSSIVLSTSEYLKRKLLKYFQNGKLIKDKINFCDIIFMGGVSLWTMDNSIIMNLWKKILEKEKNVEIPRLVLSIFNLEIDNNLPFDISQSYFYIDNQEEVEVLYHEKDYKPQDKQLTADMFDVIKEKHSIDSLDMSYMVYCNSFEDLLIISSKIRTLENVNMFYLTKDLDEKTARKLNMKRKEDQRFIVVSLSNLVPVQGISVVFDCMVEKLEYKTPNESLKVKPMYITKSIADQRKNIAGEYCYRMCTREKYDSLKSQHISETKRLPLTKLFLELIERGIDPQKFFGDTINFNIVRDEMQTLLMTKMIEKQNNKFKVTGLGEFTMSLNLSRYSSILLQYWMLREQEIFPGIVLSCIIEKADSMFFFLPIREEQESLAEHDARIKQHFIEYFQKWSSESILETYLNMWKSYSDEIQTLKPTKEQLKEWCINNSVNFKSFKDLLDTIIDTFDRLEFSLRRQITIGKFLPTKILILSEDIMKLTYSSSICQLVDAEKFKYIDSQHENFFLDTRRHYNPYVKIPYKLISFSKVSFKKDRKEIRKVIFFHPLENRFLKGKYMEPPVRTERRERKPPKKQEFDMFPVYDPLEKIYSHEEIVRLYPNNAPPRTPPRLSEYVPSSPSYPPPPDSPEYRPQTPDYSPPKETVEENPFAELETPKGVDELEDEEARLFREAFDDLSL